MVRFLWCSAILGVVMIFFGCSASTMAQTDISASLLNQSIPDGERVEIQKRLDEMFQLLRAEKYEEVYKFLTGGNVGSKKEFVSRLRKDAAGVAAGKKDWYIKESFKLDGYFVFRDELKHEVIFLDGCLTVRTSDGIKSYSGAVRARRKGTKLWYFETLPAVNPNYMSSTGPVPCTASESDKK